VSWYQEHLVDANRAGPFWMLVAFVVTFLITRFVTRRIRRREVGQEAAEGGGGGLLQNVQIGGVHVHHQVWGILLLLISAALEFAYQPGSPWLEILAGAFGVGAALTLDEFALWLHLDDVYWSDEGRKSVDAVIVAVCVGGALMLGTAPFDIDSEDTEQGFAFVVTLIAINLLTAVVALLKGKLKLGLLSLFVPTLGLIGAIRLAKPDSPWARWRYAKRPKKLERARRRYSAARLERYNRVRDAIGGAPHRPSPARPTGGEE